MSSPATLPSAYDDVVAPSPTIFVIDPDPATGKLVQDILQGKELTLKVYASGREFFVAYSGDESGCLVLEQRIFDMSGLQIQHRLVEWGQRLPMVYVTSGLDVSTAVLLMRGGATHVLEKPLRRVELFNAIHEALTIDQRNRCQAANKRRVRESLALLTQKERQLVSLVATAKSTKGIALELGLCPRAVELRCHRIMDKLGLHSRLELMRFAVIARQECGDYLAPAELEADLV